MFSPGPAQASHPKERVMSLTRFQLAIAFVFLAGPVFGQDPYGSIADLKLSKEAHGKDVAVTPPPKGAIMLFDGKSLDGWTHRDGQKPAHWKVLDSRILQVAGGGDIITKQKFAGKFRLHVEFRVPYMPKAS